ncbi:phospholipase D-like domain-containing protein [Agrococcus carbonis]|uniref:Cardiolipin synthetase 2 n=1 Tax=Agrococcus carbonis TaxID=684552 RepID=A0A1H1MPU8_9MICO|nr:phospholipase D-like domain-containing protein [Agrococcus carbonis]SDR88804.1 cardiolipin synthetase 2 [Agrococcus carbonis]
MELTLAQALTALYFTVDIALRVVAIVVVPYNRRPAAAIAWLLIIMVQPIVGWIVFSLLGNNRLPAGRRKKMAAIQEVIGETTLDVPDAPPLPGRPDWLTGVIDLNRTLSSMPHVGPSKAIVWGEFDAQLQAMARRIDEAERFVHVEFYLIVASERTEPFFAALERATARGVTVRVLVDHLTSVRYPRRKETVARLEAMGAELQDMLPLRPWRGQWQRPDLRNHRKLVVIDGRLGFTGSLNLIDPSYLWRKNLRRGLQWRDTWVELEGPAVLALDALFWSDWWAETNELVELATEAPESDGDLNASVVPSGPGFEGEINLRVFLELLHAAEQRITIVSPYFVPDDAMRYAITSAALRGIDVELFASEIGDQFWTYHAQRSYYEELLRAGVRITLFAKPTVLHSKFLTIDDRVSIIGSSNIDMRSFGLNFEVSMLVEGASMVTQLEGIADAYRQQSTQLTLDAWMARPRIAQAFDSIARLTSALQ